MLCGTYQRPDAADAFAAPVALDTGLDAAMQAEVAVAQAEQANVLQEQPGAPPERQAEQAEQPPQEQQMQQ